MTLSSTFYGGMSPQQPFDAAVVIPTICRPSLKRAVMSVFKQRFPGRIQVLIGIDAVRGDRGILDELLAARPENVAVTILELGYSTSSRHGGLHEAWDGGSLRTMLSYAANSRYVAYLDDDNWLHESHIARLLEAIRGNDWAFTLRWYVDQETFAPLCVDTFESVGPGAGVYVQKFGGFVDPNCLMIDKVRCAEILHWWTIPLPGDPVRCSADRHIFDLLRRNFRWGSTGVATAYYVIQPSDGMHPMRMAFIQQQRDTASPALVISNTRWTASV